MNDIPAPTPSFGVVPEPPVEIQSFPCQPTAMEVDSEAPAVKSELLVTGQPSPNVNLSTFTTPMDAHDVVPISAPVLEAHKPEVNEFEKTDDLKPEIPSVQPAPVVEKKPGPPNIDKETALTVLKFLRKKNLGGTASALRQELGLFDSFPDGELDEGDDVDDLSSSVWSAYKTESDPLDYEGTYAEFKKFLGESLISFVVNM